MYKIPHDPGALCDFRDELTDERRSRPSRIASRLGLIAKQQDRLEEMLGFVLEHSPHYRGVAAENGLSYRHGLAIFRRLPLLTRRNYAECLAQLKVWSKHLCYRDRTTGTSGTPVDVFRDSRSVLFESLRLRGTLEYYIRDTARFARGRVAVVYVSHYPGSHEHIYDDPVLDGAKIVKVRCDLGSVGYRFKVNGLTLNHNSFALSGTVSSLLYLAKNREARVGLPKPALVLPSGEMLSSGARKLLNETFRAPVFELYSLREFGTVAFQCKRGVGLHLNSDWFVIEVIDGKGMPVSDAERGELVITDLGNQHVPLLRYATGDSGSVRWCRCGCGLALPLLIDLSGRTPVYFIASDGTALDTAVFAKRAQKLSLLWYRVIQAADRSVTIEYVSFDDGPTPGIKKLCAKMSRALEAHVCVKQVNPEIAIRHGKDGGFHSLLEH